MCILEQSTSVCSKTESKERLTFVFLTARSRRLALCMLASVCIGLNALTAASLLGSLLLLLLLR